MLLVNGKPAQDKNSRWIHSELRKRLIDEKGWSGFSVQAREGVITERHDDSVDQGWKARELAN